MKRVYPKLFARHKVRPVGNYGQDLLNLLRFVAPKNCPDPGDPTVVLLTPGIYNSAYFEHSFLARSMGIESSSARISWSATIWWWMKTTRGLRRVDVIYRRLTTIFLDPTVFRPEFLPRRARAHQRLSQRVT
jgi:uncharacterized circularly permuted ATP-grasp superfamily protein